MVKKKVRHKPKPKNGSGQYIDVRSETRPELVHHVYTGDGLNGFHCTCEAFLHGTRESGALFTCKHIRSVLKIGGS